MFWLTFSSLKAINPDVYHIFQQNYAKLMIARVQERGVYLCESSDHAFARTYKPKTLGSIQREITWEKSQRNELCYKNTYKCKT